MIIILILAAALSTPVDSRLHDFASAISQNFHKKCIGIISEESRHRSSLSSLVCGEKITDENLKTNLSRTSLIHIFVISGSHLILLDQLLSILRIPVYLRFLFLLFYSLIAGWEAPAVRALLGLGLRQAFKFKKLYFPADLMVLLTGFTCLILFPTWWQSLSFLMSWCAALALTTPGIFRVRNSLHQMLYSQFAIYFFMLAPLWGLGSLHPLSVLYNLFLAPAVSFVLLPLSFLTIPVSALVPVFDSLMDGFNGILPYLAEPILLAPGTTPTLGILWLWIFSWHLILHFVRISLWQGKI